MLSTDLRERRLRKLAALEVCERLLRDEVQVRPRLLEGDTRLEASQPEQPVGVRSVQSRLALDLRLHRQRNPDVRRTPNHLARERPWPDADDGQGLAVQPDRSPGDVRSTSEAPVPEPIADDHDRTSAGRAILIIAEGATDDGGNTEHVEVVGRDQ